MGKLTIMAGFAALPGTSKIGTHIGQDIEKWANWQLWLVLQPCLEPARSAPISGKISKNGQIGNYGWFCSLAWNQQDRHPYRARYRKMGKLAIMAGFAALPGTSKIGTHIGQGLLSHVSVTEAVVPVQTSQDSWLVPWFPIGGHERARSGATLCSSATDRRSVGIRIFRSARGYALRSGKHAV